MAKKLKTAVYILSILGIIWILGSWADVVINNLNGGQYLSFNFFKVVF